MLRKCQKDENSNFLTYTLAYSAEASMTVVQSFQQQPPLAQKSLETYEKVKERPKIENFYLFWFSINNIGKMFSTTPIASTKKP